MNIVFAGILDQGKFLDSGEEEYVVLQLLGNNYQDTSVNNHPVSIVGNVPINNGGFNITHNGDNYLEIPDHPDFDFQGEDYYIQFDFKSLITNISTAHLVSKHAGGNNYSFYSRLLTASLAYAFKKSNTGTTSTSSNSFPNTDYLTDFQTLKIYRSNTSNNPNFAAIKYFYNDVLLNEVLILKTDDVITTTAPIVIGRHFVGSKFAVDFVLRNIKIVRFL